MALVYLKMGKSTILRFVEKPKKVVVGNQNYYGLEFIENDVAIQPLGAVGTNLFVYTEHHTYGFLLTPGERYDDLVFVRWKYGKAEQPVRETPAPPARSTNLNSTFRVGEAVAVSVEKIQRPSASDLYIVDCEIENLSSENSDLSTLELRATRGGKALAEQSIVIEREKLKAHEKTRARIFMKLDTKTDFTIEGKFKSSNGKVTISRKYL